jgi:alanine racemase
MNYTLSEICDIIKGDIIGQTTDNIVISHVVYDTRKISYSSASIFIALRGEKNDGHKYIADAIEKGIKAFLIDRSDISTSQQGVQYIKVDDTLRALQTLAAHHRKQFSYPVIGITGSNGKTTVKEWLHQILNQDLRVLQSPQSYNSQLGVALSLLMMEDSHDLAIIEAGISRMDEMDHLYKMIQPTIGIFTNIGDAHSSGFENIKIKVQEKIKLFQSADTLIYNKDNELIDQSMQSLDIPHLITWGSSDDAEVQVDKTKNEGQHTHLQIRYNKKDFTFKIPFTQKDLLSNCVTVISYLLSVKWDENKIQNSIKHIKGLNNRLELREGKSNCILINDSYSLDLASLRLALEYQDQHNLGKSKVLIISDIADQRNNEDLYIQLKTLIQEKNIEQIIGIGFSEKSKQLFNLSNVDYYNTTDQCLLNFPFKKLKNSCILIKGARQYQLEKIYHQLSLRAHETVLETDYNAVAHNLKVFKSYIPESTMMMAILKAEAYGSGSVPMAHFLADKGINYLGVALIDEAIKIRESGVETPIMIFNVQESHLDLLWKYNLEPEIYSFRLLELFIKQSEIEKQELSIHLKVDTGMHRLGFLEEEIDTLLEILHRSKYIKVCSVFSHLSASEDKRFDTFTKEQIAQFDKLYALINQSLKYNPIRHILNTGGILRHNHSSYEMVRLGIGLYGVDTSNNNEVILEKAHSLSTKVLQIKKLKKGETTGYSRSGVATKDMTIAIIGLGYADGLMRAAGNGNGQVYINGKPCPTVGNICMDVSIIDISTYNQIREGDKVVIFSSNIPIENLAKSCNTISYEILTRISPRVKRTYIYN